jgi:carboxyl-terminal processing protease
MIKNILFFLITFLHFPQIVLAESNTDDLSALDLFGEVFYKIKTDYVESQSNQKLVEAAINGMLSSLDPHSGYLDKKTFDEMRTHIKGEFGGIGIDVIMDNGLVQIISPIEDTPAYKVGLKAGDYIIMIDDETVMSMTFSEAVKKMRGPKGTQLNLTVLREGVKDPLEFKIIRDIINVMSVKSRPEGDIAYIKITTFGEKTAEETLTAFHNLKNKIGKNLKGLIVDLRGNPGGSFDQSIAVSNLFLEEGEIVSTRGKNKDNITRYRAKPGKMMTSDNLPIVVLIDGGSASASEIVAGALQDHKKAIIIGTQSFGKGTVQTVIPLPGDSGAMRLTTSRYYTPSGKSIQAEGITPDILVEQAKIEFPNISSKFKYKESAFKNHLTKESKEELKILTKEEKEKEHKKALEAISKKETIKTIEDYQLSRAIDLLKTIQFLGLEKSIPLQIKASEK